MRRQNHSCDQCRRSKRACDASSSNLEWIASLNGRLPDSTDVAPRPCSYCLKTRKKCTLAWAARVHQQAGRKQKQKPGRRRTESAESCEPESSNYLETLPVEPSNGLWNDSTIPVFRGSVSDESPQAPDAAELLYQPPAFPEDGVSSLSPAKRSHNDLPIPPADSVSTFPSEVPDTSPSDLSELVAQEYPRAPSTSIESWNDWHSNGFSQSWEISLPCRDCQTLADSSQGNSDEVDSSSSESWERRNELNGQTQAFNNSLSPFLPNQTIASRSSHQFISSGLLRIYHDVLENNLTCWLTEATCPYKSSDVALYRANLPDQKREWSSLWSNRMYARTLQLDRVAMANGMVRLTQSESQAAARALSLCIVAFAAQWAQGSQRQKEKYHDGQKSPGIHPNSPESANSGATTEEFDRKMQRQLWEQAHKALQEVSDVESFRVACAEIIFGLTQKPLGDEVESSTSTVPDVSTSSRGAQCLKSHVLEQLSALISIEGPPIYMERAARKMQTLKSRFDSSLRGFGSEAYGCSSKTPANRPLIGYEHHATIDLLYWLAVMFDTISSSMNNRPVVVSDEESHHHSPPKHSHDIDGQSNDSASVDRWNIESFIQDDILDPKKVPAWPCSYEEAADAVVNSAPVKVLLFRHISYLQSMLRKGVRGKCIEDLIDSTTHVYRYWEMTYGSFFRSLVGAIDFVPFRIQGWFSCISAHWHLAALMLSDILDYVDNNVLGTLFGTQCRTIMKTSASIRDKTIKDLSDLARISTPRGEGAVNATASNQEEFHHAVNGCVILTEPWTLILINAFSKASTVLLGAAEESLNDHHGGLGGMGEELGELITNLGMAEECIKALWHLGKKSDLSRKSAEILSVALNKLHVSLGVTC